MSGLVVALVLLVSTTPLFYRWPRTVPMYAAKILADSIDAVRHVRLTTMEVCFPRFILAEFNTHRMLSRNSASSRAIPVERRIAQVWANPFVPEAFGVNKGGMQASANLGGWKATLARFLWILASRVCVVVAWCMSKIDVHKQHANRIIELWAWHTVVVSATEWENFYALRTHKDAQPEMQITAKAMRVAYDASTPRKVHEGGWHLPYVDDDELAGVGGGNVETERAMMALVRESVVRSAAVSFERQNAARTGDAITKRHDGMTKSAHWSPFEHAAKVATQEEMKQNAMWIVIDHPEAGENLHAGFIGNFRAPWMQYRKAFENESIFDGGTTT